jgi:hypothetical protein
MFILEEIIGAIYDSYETLPGGREPIGRDESRRPFMGNLDVAAHGAPPRVVWTLTNGSFGDSKLNGGPEGAHYQALATFAISIWQKDLETCWAVMVDLLAAMRSTVYGPNLGAQNFIATTEREGRHDHDGELLVLTVVLSVPIPIVGTVPETQVELASHESNISLGNEAAVLDDSYVEIETVVIDGPPED